MENTPSSTPIRIEGKHFFKGDSRFLVRGVVHQPHDTHQRSPTGGYRPNNALKDELFQRLEHEVGLFTDLGVNTIYVYSVDNTQPHDRSMKFLADAGIYVFTSLTTPHCCISRFAPLESYQPATLLEMFKTIDLMTQYPNTLGVLVSQHLINDAGSESLCAPVLAAVVRDLKRYMRLKRDLTGQRILPLGYGAAAAGERDRRVLEYLTSRDEKSRIDFWAGAHYTWAGSSDGDASGYRDVSDRYKDAKIPLFLCEYGSRPGRGLPRSFDETRALYSPEMTQVFSGGCVYEMWQGTNDYGLVQLIPKVEESGNVPGSRARHAQRARDAYQGEILETRETPWGELQLYEDFRNYKARLQEAERMSSAEDRGVQNAAATPSDSDTRHEEAPADPQDSALSAHVPETCIDWAGIEAALRAGESFDDIYLDLSKQPGKCRVAESGLGWKPAGGSGGQTFTLDKQDIQSASWSRAARGYELKVFARNAGVVLLDGFRPDDYDAIRKCFQVWFGVELVQREHALRGWNWGKSELGRNELTFNVRNQPAFEIPYTEISNTNLAGKNEVAVELSLPQDGQDPVDGVNGTKKKGQKTGGAVDQLTEMRFYIPGTEMRKGRKKNAEEDGEDAQENGEEEENAANLFYEALMDKAEIGEVAGDTFATFLDILHLTPRGRFDIDLYE
ncbi:FACT complex subunit, partial [Hortaea werneckii]